jgi:hypothetical protein
MSWLQVQVFLCAYKRTVENPCFVIPIFSASNRRCCWSIWMKLSMAGTHEISWHRRNSWIWLFDQYRLPLFLCMALSPEYVGVYFLRVAYEDAGFILHYVSHVFDPLSAVNTQHRLRQISARLLLEPFIFLHPSVTLMKWKCHNIIRVPWRNRHTTLP